MYLKIHLSFKKLLSLHLVFQRAACGNGSGFGGRVEADEKSEKNGGNTDGKEIPAFHTDGISGDDEGAFRRKTDKSVQLLRLADNPCQK